MKKLRIFYWHNHQLSSKTGYEANHEYTQYDLNEMIQHVFSVGLNVMLLNEKDEIIFCIAEGKFNQR